MQRILQTKWKCGLSALLLTGFFSGCQATGPSLFRMPLAADHKGPTPGSEEWWDQEAQRPVGTRQKKKKGKIWPVSPRPSGPKQQFSHKFHAAHYWPHPYNCQDQAVVHQMMNDQAANGWAEATTLYEYHFDEATHELTIAGLQHLRWILQFAQPEYRMVYVQSAYEPAVTESRLSSVRTAAGKMVGPGEMPSVTARLTAPLGRPAEEIDAIRKAELQSMPTPRVGGATSAAMTSQTDTGVGTGTGGQ